MKAVSAVVFLIGLASFAVLGWAARKAMILERTADIGDVLILSIFALFGSFCMWMGWRVFQARPASPASAAAAAPSAVPSPESPPKRITMSQGCSTAGVVLLMLSVLLPERFYPVVFLFLGLALLATAHVFTPCEERLEKLRKARASLRQL